MKILAIRFKNLASLEDTNEIDFTKEPLRSAGIFAITGPTGAGKSTLLDALCLALYAKTPRYQKAELGVEVQDVTGNKIQQNDVRGILRDGTGDGFAQVEFAGTDGNNYRATWSVKRARNKIDGNLQSDTIELFNVSTNSAVPGKKMETLREIERLVGLNFEQFTRSVLLAQGDFTAFLKADKDAKASLLEKLTGTDIYSEISRSVFEKYKLADADLKNLKLQLAGIATLSEEEHAALTAQRQDLIQQIAGQEKILSGLSDEIGWHQLLAHLSASREQAEQQHLEAVTAMENAGDRIRTFTLVENIQPARGLIEAKKASAQQLVEKTAGLQELQARIQHTSESHQSALRKLEAANAALNGHLQDNLRYQPDIDRAKELDTLIGEKGRQVNNAAAESLAAQQKQDAHVKALEQKENEIDKVAAAIEKLEDWQKEHLSRRDIAENITVISTQLGHAAKLLPLQQKALEEQRNNATFIQTAANTIASLQATMKAREQERAGLFSSYEAINNTVAAIPIDTLKAKEANLAADIREADAAKAHWEVLYTNLREKEHTTRRHDNCKDELAAKVRSLEEKQEQLKEARAKRDMADKLLHQARLQVAENVESLRAQLIPDEPCPVCGSKEHPFSIENPLAHALLKGLEDEHSAALQAYNTLSGEISSLTELCNRLRLDITSHEEALADRERQITALEQKWQTFRLAATSAAQSADGRASWLTAHIQELLSAQIEYAAHISAYEEKRKEAERQKGQLDSLDRSLAATDEQVKDKQREKISKEEAQQRIQQQLDNIEEDLQVMTDLLAPHFNNPAWIDNWKKDPKKFDDTIRSFSDRWKENAQAITDHIQQQKMLHSALQEMRRQAPSLSADVDSKVRALQELQEKLTQLSAERKTLLNGSEVALFERMLKQAYDEAVAVQQSANEAVTLLKEELLAYTTAKTATEKDITSLNTTISRQEAEIKAWITAYNTAQGGDLSEDMLTALLVYSGGWIDQERKAIDDIRKAVTTTKATLDERTLQVSNHTLKRITARSLEEVQAHADETRALLKDTSNEKNNIDYRLRQDAENKLKIGGLQKAIASKTAVHENWSKLNDLIGSADGKKFRQIAQEYTLDILLGYANMHLQMLTSRYKLLRIPGNLGLQVLDKDMGDELRTVFSLSGGESFLVSLALALGLASLSSSKMKVESLFIDEGFGALDPDTLNVAVDALERLHNQGRKVGVISHVQEMTERIPTQIRVIRLANGKSKVEVVGA
jgi:exonuclease SbcC